MSIITPSTVKDAWEIVSCGNRVLVFSKTLWIFQTDGSFVTHQKAVRYPRKAAFLQDNTAILEANSTYFHIDLTDGSVLWSNPRKKGICPSINQFAVSPDGTVVFDFQYMKDSVVRIDRICPGKQTVDSYSLKDGLSITNDLYCKDQDTLYILQYSTLIDPEAPLFSTVVPMRQNGILELKYSAENPEREWKHMWQDQSSATHTPRKTDGRYVLYNDFSVLDLKTMEYFSILPEHNLGKYKFGEMTNLVFHEDRNLLSFGYICQDINVILDCRKREVVAQYVSRKKGCLVGTEFWIGTENGIVRRPFPWIDDIS
ncbi:MAG: hypothetical protein IKB09_04650 [Oscillospiraceae bacterium]|nr:hypothetical protein [Oscillospiraceae bacterium]